LDRHSRPRSWQSVMISKFRRRRCAAGCGRRGSGYPALSVSASSNLGIAASILVSWSDRQLRASLVRGSSSCLHVTGVRRRCDKPTAPASPWQNGFAERLIGSIRRECVDHIIVLGEMHLRRVLKSYADYYNCVRTHRSLNKDAPVSRPVQRTGVISSRAILGGLHHRYARV